MTNRKDLYFINYLATTKCLCHSASWSGVSLTGVFSISSVPIPVAAWVCGRSLAGTAGSNPAGGMDVCLL